MSAERKPIISTIGFGKFFHDMLHRRHRFRQFVGIVFLIVLAVAANPIPALYYAGIVCTALGIAIRMWASGHVNKNQELATTGPYSYVRHPLYVGNHLIGLGFCLASALWWGLLGWLVLGLYFYPQTIRHEDAFLERRFPQEWADWSRHTKALIPRLKPYRPGVRGEWSFKQSLHRNGEPIIAAFLGVCLYSIFLRLP
jgi:protein-S-isoprenylcysteine O-methyltransferase Ste14